MRYMYTMLIKEVPQPSRVRYKYPQGYYKKDHFNVIFLFVFFSFLYTYTYIYFPL